jgi:hypothetical protein
MSAPAYSLVMEPEQDAKHSYTLHIDVPTILAGDILTGHVTLNLALAETERLAALKLELRGTATTLVNRCSSHSDDIVTAD